MLIHKDPSLCFKKHLNYNNILYSNYYKIAALVKKKIKNFNLWATYKDQTCLHYCFGMDEKMQKWAIKMIEADKPLHKGLEELNSNGMGDLLLLSLLQHVFPDREGREYTRDMGASTEHQYS